MAVRKQGTGRYTTQFGRGAYFDRRRVGRKPPAAEDSPLYDPLYAVGFDPTAIGRILARFPVEQIQLWVDVTLAALEHKGPAFFRRSPPAFFMDNIQHAARGNRTPPDWFWALRQQEQQRQCAAQRIWKARSKFVDTEKLHRYHLQPDEQRWFLPEDLVVDPDIQVIPGNDHLPGRLSEVDLVPVEQVNFPVEQEKEDEGSLSSLISRKAAKIAEKDFPAFPDDDRFGRLC